MSTDSKVLAVSGVTRQRQKVPNWNFNDGKPFWKCPQAKRHGLWKTKVALKLGDTYLGREQAEQIAKLFNDLMAKGQPFPALGADAIAEPVPSQPQRVIAAPPAPRASSGLITVAQACRTFLTDTIKQGANAPSHMANRRRAIYATEDIFGPRMLSTITSSEIRAEYERSRVGRPAAAREWFKHTRALFYYARDDLKQPIEVNFRQIEKIIKTIEQREQDEINPTGNKEIKMWTAREWLTSVAIADHIGLTGAADALVILLFTGILPAQAIKLTGLSFERGRFIIRRMKTRVQQVIDQHPMLSRRLEIIFDRNRKLYPDVSGVLINSRTGQRFKNSNELRTQVDLVREFASGDWQRLRAWDRTLKRPMPSAAAWPFPALPSVLGKELQHLRHNYCTEVVARHSFTEAVKRTGHKATSAGILWDEHYLSRDAGLSDVGQGEPPFAWVDLEWMARHPNSPGHSEIEGCRFYKVA